MSKVCLERVKTNKTEIIVGQLDIEVKTKKTKIQFKNLKQIYY